MERPKSVAVRKNEIRIIGGLWRSRRLAFPSSEGLRPTPDRVRETLFNWLRSEVEGSVCLDLYAGSGALGFEAASRGASQVVMVESQPDVLRALKENCSRLDARQVQVIGGCAKDYLGRDPESFDLVFLDPPFRRGWLARSAALLEARNWLGPSALIYLEGERGMDFSLLPSNWSTLREGVAGEVAFRLCRRQSGRHSHES